MHKPVATLLCDCYKVSHKDQYPIGTEMIYSTLTPRTNQYAPHIDKVVSFGLIAFVQKYLKEYFNENFFKLPIEEALEKFNSLNKSIFGKTIDSSHIQKLWDLGYLPLEIKAIPEGKTVDLKIPVMTIKNTHPEFAWLTNYFETLISCSTWQPMTSASIARKYRQLCEKFAEETCDNNLHVPFQCHDFSMRGLSSLESAQLSGAGHLVFFTGTDTIPAVDFINYFYQGENTFVGGSIPATEHSVMSSHGMNELETFRYLINTVYPSGFVSIVSDTYDFWKNVTVNLPILKEEIMARDGKVVIRPDSGDPVDILCGKEVKCFRSIDDLKRYCITTHRTGVAKVQDKYFEVTAKVSNFNPGDFNFGGIYHLSELTDPEKLAIHKGLIESLWDIFGGNINSKGYKVLDEHIGAIYGDSITLERASKILTRLEEKGFASSNVVFGVGSYTYQYNTRDTLGFAVKSTYAIINGEGRLIFKDPKTDSGIKKSQRGMVKVIENGTKLIDNLYHTDDFSDDEMEVIFVNGETFGKSIEEIRATANQYL